MFVQNVSLTGPSVRTNLIAIVQNARAKRIVCPAAPLSRTARQGLIICACSTGGHLRSSAPKFRYGQVDPAFGAWRAQLFLDDRQRKRQRLNARDASAELSLRDRVRIAARSIPSAWRIKVCLDTTVGVVAVRRTYGPSRGQRARSIGIIAQARRARLLGRRKGAFEHEYWCVLRARGRFVRPCHDKRNVFPRRRSRRHAGAARAERRAAVAAVRSSIVLLANAAIVGVDLGASCIDEIRRAPFRYGPRVAVRRTVLGPRTLAALDRHVWIAVISCAAATDNAALSHKSGDERKACNHCGEYDPTNHHPGKLHEGTRQTQGYCKRSEYGNWYAGKLADRGDKRIYERDKRFVRVTPFQNIERYGAKGILYFTLEPPRSGLAN